MNNKFLSAFVLSLLIAPIFISSCNRTDSQSVTEETNDSIISFKTVGFSHLYFYPESKKICGQDVYYQVSLSLMLPESPDGKGFEELRRAIEKTAIGTIAEGESIEKAFETYAEKSAKEFSNFGPCEPLDNSNGKIEPTGFRIINGDVASMTPEILSYAISVYDYAILAANGSTYLRYLNYDFKTKKILTLQSIFNEEQLKNLPELIANKVHETYPSANIDTIPEEFYFDYQGRIVFVYQQGEVLYRAAGPVTAAFYPQELGLGNID